MDGTAWVGAVVSLVAALVALTAAVFARRSAWEVASLNHRIAALDREADRFLEDFRAFVTAANTCRSFAEWGTLQSAASILLTHPRTDGQIRLAVEGIVEAVYAALTNRKGRDADGGVFIPIENGPHESLEEGVRAALEAISAQRLRRVRDRDRLRWWPWSRSTDKG